MSLTMPPHQPRRYVFSTFLLPINQTIISIDFDGKPYFHHVRLTYRLAQPDTPDPGVQRLWAEMQAARREIKMLRGLNVRLERDIRVCRTHCARGTCASGTRATRVEAAAKEVEAVVSRMEGLDVGQRAFYAMHQGQTGGENLSESGVSCGDGASSTAYAPSMAHTHPPSSSRYPVPSNPVEAQVAPPSGVHHPPPPPSMVPRTFHSSGQGPWAATDITISTANPSTTITVTPIPIGHDIWQPQPPQVVRGHHGWFDYPRHSGNGLLPMTGLPAPPATGGPIHPVHQAYGDLQLPFPQHHQAPGTSAQAWPRGYPLPLDPKTPENRHFNNSTEGMTPGEIQRLRSTGALAHSVAIRVVDSPAGNAPAHRRY